MSNGNKSLKIFFNSNKFIGSFQSYKDIKKINSVKDCCLWEDLMWENQV